MAAVRKFFSWLLSEQQIAYNPASTLQLPKQPQRLSPGVLTKSEASYPEFAADSIGHVLKEYYTANKKYAGQHDSVAFPPSHDKALKFESKVLSNYTGRKEQKSQEAAPAPNTIRFIYTTVHYDIVLKSGVPGGPKDTVQSVSRQNNTSPGVP